MLQEIVQQIEASQNGEQQKRRKHPKPWTLKVAPRPSGTPPDGKNKNAFHRHKHPRRTQLSSKLSVSQMVSPSESFSSTPPLVDVDQLLEYWERPSSCTRHTSTGITTLASRMQSPSPTRILQLHAWLIFTATATMCDRIIFATTSHEIQDPWRSHKHVLSERIAGSSSYLTSHREWTTPTHDRASLGTVFKPRRWMVHCEILSSPFAVTSTVRVLLANLSVFTSTVMARSACISSS